MLRASARATRSGRHPPGARAAPGCQPGVRERRTARERSSNGGLESLTAIYLVVPVARISLRQALIGGVTAGLLWEITRHGLVWYDSSLSQIPLVYGSFTTAILVLRSVELAAIALLLGARVIAEFERVGQESVDDVPKPMRTEGPPP
jgi:membrane protein